MVFNGGRLEPFLRLAYKDLPEDVTLVSTGVFTGGGELSNPSATSVDVDFKKVDALIMGRKLSNDGDIRISYRDGKLDLKSFRLRGDELTLEASGIATGYRQGGRDGEGEGGPGRAEAFFKGRRRLYKRARTGGPPGKRRPHEPGDHRDGPGHGRGAQGKGLPAEVRQGERGGAGRRRKLPGYQVRCGYRRRDAFG